MLDQLYTQLKAKYFRHHKTYMQEFQLANEAMTDLAMIAEAIEGGASISDATIKRIQDSLGESSCV